MRPVAGCEMATSAHTMSARKKFWRYSPEKENRTETTSVKNNPVLEKLKSLWDAVPVAFQNNYDFVESEVRRSGIDYTAKDVEDFSVWLGEVKESRAFSVKAGMVLSALINAGKDDHYTVHTEHIDVEYFGYGLTKVVTVKGDLVSICTNLEGGEIFLEGTFLSLCAVPAVSGIPKGTIYSHAGSLRIENDQIELISGEKMNIVIRG